MNTQQQVAANPIVYMLCAGDRTAHRYELINRETSSVYGSGRPGWGVQFKASADRRLISDEFSWFEGSAQQRDEFVAALVAKHSL